LPIARLVAQVGRETQENFMPYNLDTRSGGKKSSPKSSFPDQ